LGGAALFGGGDWAGGTQEDRSVYAVRVLVVFLIHPCDFNIFHYTLVLFQVDSAELIIYLLSGRVVDLATNCYGCHVLQKALDCEEEEVRLLIVSELLMGDPAQTLVNKHASHVWSKVCFIVSLSRH
jgi:hypothetical protein